jgi:glycosyltransferase involved in cell wall biosynthesis
MNSPRVSVCLPNLNNRPFLEERLSTILDQSFTDWELVIYDNFSDDGAWEFFQQAAANDARIRIAQAPRQGMYANWNNCINAARGEYVYVATSDDNMASDCLEKLVEALDANPECDLAHCALRMFDANGDELPSEWWSQWSLFARSSGPVLHQRHLRRAPFDGILHLSGDTVYTSITQLLIRRSLFARTGLFESRWGSLGDFNWNMRAGLLANAVHVPDTWGGWRQHTAQATAAARFGSTSHVSQIDDMIDHAIATVSTRLDSGIQRALRRKWNPRMRGMRKLDLAMGSGSTRLKRRISLLYQLAGGSWFAWRHLINRLRRVPDSPETLPRLLAGWLKDEGITPVLVPLEARECCSSC